jgi:hypothetical protein
MNTQEDRLIARQKLTEEGFLEDSGKRVNGKIVWRISLLGHIAGTYRAEGFSWEQAKFLAKKSLS